MAPQTDVTYDTIEVADVAQNEKRSVPRVALVVGACLALAAVVGYATMTTAAPKPAVIAVADVADVPDVQDTEDTAACQPQCANGSGCSYNRAQCCSCNSGYYKSGTSCYAWGGSCSGWYRTLTRRFLAGVLRCLRLA